MKYTVVENDVNVLGTLWMGGTAAYTYQPPVDVVQEVLALHGSKARRERVREWLDTHAGDFQAIIDFQVDFDNPAPFKSEWAEDKSESVYFDCVDPQ